MKKNTLRYLALFLVAMNITSCNRFLETTPEDIITPVNYYDTEARLNDALVGVYTTLTQARMYQDGVWNRLGAATDESYTSLIGQARVETNVYNSNDNTVRDFYSNLYQGIERANLLLENVDKPVILQSKKDLVKGQALFLRGYYYFLLASVFGDVPLKTASTKSANDAVIPRTPLNEVYAQILKDMTEAEAILPDITAYGGHNGKVSKTAAQAILARVCLTMAGEPLKDISKFQAAKDWANKVITSGKHSLNPDYKQIFINHSQDKYDTKECLWEVEFWGNQIGNNFSLSSRLGYNTGPTCSNINFGFATGLIRPTERLFRLYEPTDVRRDWNISPFRYKNPVNPGFTTTGAIDPEVRINFTETQIWERFSGKWYREFETISPKSQIQAPTNFPIIRYSDVLLMFAEAANELSGPTGESVNAFNQVRTRAKASLITPNSKEVFRQAIQDERARELCYEGLRRPDLIRWGIYLTAMKTFAADVRQNAPTAFKNVATQGEVLEEKDRWFRPIPLYEFTVNPKLVQNPGW
jgi:hypothetical protein